ncbi:MAG: glucose-6-phosphate isomerase [Buchnera aphidicola (Eriosoma harunire)]
MKFIDPIKTCAWKKLKDHFKYMKNVHIKDLFTADLNRFKHFSINIKDVMLIDFSKHRINSNTMNELLALAKELHVEKFIQLMFHGDKINYTENRSVLHIALRNRKNTPIMLNNRDVMLDINRVLNKMQCFSDSVINGCKKGYTGKSITDVVCIGIGGSNLGPYMVTEALRPYKNHLNIHFVSNLDASHISETLNMINPETTLFIISSKTFTTEETMINAYSARNWFLDRTGNIKHITNHFLAISMNISEVKKFGISEDHYFEFWDWVGGRYSLWSSVGLPIILSIGFDNFLKLLSGAHDMDEHFLSNSLDKNAPVILALISIWYNNFFNFETEAIFSYDQNMHKFSAYLQQANMESNGKSINRNGQSVSWQTGPIIWGESGTNGQHAFYQLLHQGTKIIPADFIVPVNTHYPIGDHHLRLLSHCFAQTRALAFGKSIEDQKKLLLENNRDVEYIDRMIPFKFFAGNRPSNTILINKITPYSLGLLLSLYEHKIFVQGLIFNIFSFDQWGVELGKELASDIFTTLKNCPDNYLYDDSTNNLLCAFNKWNVKN